MPEWRECAKGEVCEFDLCVNGLEQQYVDCAWWAGTPEMNPCTVIYRGRKYCAPKLDFRHPERRLFEDSVEKVLGIDFISDDVLNDIGGRLRIANYPRFTAAARRMLDAVLAEGVACA